MKRHLTRWGATLGLVGALLSACSDSNPTDTGTVSGPHVAVEVTPRGDRGRVVSDYEVESTPGQGASGVDSLRIVVPDSSFTVSGGSYQGSFVVDNRSEVSLEHCVRATAFQGEMASSSQDCFTVEPAYLDEVVSLNFREFDGARRLSDGSVASVDGNTVSSGQLLFSSGQEYSLNNGVVEISGDDGFIPGVYRALLSDSDRADMSFSVRLGHGGGVVPVRVVPSWSRAADGFDYSDLTVFMRDNSSLDGYVDGERVIISHREPISVLVDDGPALAEIDGEMVRMDSTRVSPDSVALLRLPERFVEYVVSVAEEDFPEYLPQCSIDIVFRSDDPSSFPSADNSLDVPYGGIRIQSSVDAIVAITHATAYFPGNVEARRAYMGVRAGERRLLRRGFAADLHESTGPVHLLTRGEDRQAELDHINLFLEYSLDREGTLPGPARPLDSWLSASRLWYTVPPGSGVRFDDSFDRLIDFYLANTTRPFRVGQELFSWPECD